MHGLLKQAAKFVTIGAGATALHVASALLFNSFAGFTTLESNFLAFLFASAFTFCGNYFWTFSKAGKFTDTIPRFIVLSSCCFAVNQTIVYVVTHMMHLPLWIAMIPVVAVIPTFSFWVSKTRVFTTHSPPL
jgi:putative flippase GtrA